MSTSSVPAVAYAEPFELGTTTQEYQAFLAELAAAGVTIEGLTYTPAADVARGEVRPADPLPAHDLPPPIDARTPGQRGDKVWIRPFYNSGCVMLLSKLEKGFVYIRHFVGRGSDGWVSLRMATTLLGTEAGRDERTPAVSQDHIWITPFWSGGFAVRKEDLSSGVYDVPHRVRTNRSGQVTLEHCLDPRRAWMRPEVSPSV